MNTPLDRWLRDAALLLLLGTAAAGAGCTSSARYSVAAETAAPGSSLPASYRIVPGRGLALPALEAAMGEQLVRDVRTALSSHGWYEVPPGMGPAVEIEVDLEQHAPVLRTSSVLEPVYAAVAATPGRDPGIESSSGSPRKIGEREVFHTVVVYPRTLRVVAREAAGPRDYPADTPVWRVWVEGEGTDELSGRDLRWMVAAAMDWLGRDTEAARRVVVRSSDRRVAFLARGMGPAARVPAVAGEEPGHALQGGT